ncbi:hypothetical protein GHT06_010989 [Daphnia sinensis]|uniref:Platelet-derived growth factor (PDGF) family profile domain-containing protein n=1 Tax=Daphnia sinensis TaxID=1820382 RepID=A0AAD5KZC0_9CRUS|nr:hypothetical protein GHT06_010989 [Daphnia sinensis]
MAAEKHCWFILFVLHLPAFVIEGEATNKQVPFSANFKATVKRACGHPQPRLVHIDELEEYRVPNAIYVPQALVIHRCGRSVGYCHAPVHACVSVESDEEDVTFHVKNLFTPSKPEWSMITLRNHTRCKCARSASVP